MTNQRSKHRFLKTVCHINEVGLSDSPHGIGWIFEGDERAPKPQSTESVCEEIKKICFPALIMEAEMTKKWKKKILEFFLHSTRARACILFHV